MRDFLAQTWFSLTAHKLRCFLTMFGVIWGVTSIVLLSAVGEGFQRGNQAALRELGRNIVVIRNGRTSLQEGGERAGRAIRLTLGDLSALRQKSRLLEFVSPELVRSGVKVKSAFNEASVGTTGVWPIYQSIRSIELEKGRLMNEFDREQARRVVIMGFDVCKQLFADRDPIDREVSLNGIPYTVIGRMRKKSQDSSYNGFDNDRLFIPYESMRRDFPLRGGLNTADSLSAIVATPYEGASEELSRIFNIEGAGGFDRNGPVEQEIRTLLAVKHGFDPQDREALSIWNTAIESVLFDRIVGNMREFFSAVSLITLLLGGIGVMNIMLIAVKERTREIGLRKAIGATARNIQWQFFSEGLIITLLSGSLGLMAGSSLCWLANRFPMPARFSGMIVTWQTVAYSVATLAVIGIAASTYPARRAARLQPIEALRYDL